MTDFLPKIKLHLLAYESVTRRGMGTLATEAFSPPKIYSWLSPFTPYILSGTFYQHLLSFGAFHTINCKYSGSSCYITKHALLADKSSLCPMTNSGGISAHATRPEAQKN